MFITHFTDVLSIIFKNFQKSLKHLVHLVYTNTLKDVRRKHRKKHNSCTQANSKV